MNLRACRLIFKAFISIFLILFIDKGYAQQSDTSTSKWYIETGFGYFNPNARGTGNMLYSEIGYKLSTGYNVGIGFGLGDVFTEYDETNQLFSGMRSYHNYYLARVFLNRSIHLDSQNKHLVKIGAGVLYEQPRFSEPKATLNPIFNENGDIIDYKLVSNKRQTDSKYIELGVPFHLSYSFNFEHLTIGARAEYHLLYSTGFGGGLLLLI